MAEEKTSVWKKEISLRRTPKLSKEEKAAVKRDKVALKAAAKAEKKAAQAPKAPKAPKPAKAAKVAKPAERDAGKTSVWKKEISFRRKLKAAPEPPAVVESAPPAPPRPLVPAAPPVAPALVPAPSLPPAAVRPLPPAPPVRPAPNVQAPAPAPAPALPPAPPVPAAARSLPPAPPVPPVPSAQTPTPPAAEQAVEPAPSSEAPPPAAPPVEAAPPLPAPEPSPSDPSLTDGEDTLVLPSAAAAPEAAPELAPAPEDAAEPAPAPAEKRRGRPPFGRKKGENVEKAQAGKRGWKQRGSSRGAKAKKLVGVKVGASQLAAARVANNGSIELLQIAREPLEAGIVVAGELRDPDALAAALKQFFKKHKLPKRGIRLGISNNRIGVRVFEIAGVTDPDQLRNAVRFRAQEALPIAVDEAVLDYHVVGESIDDQGEPVKRVVLVVAYRNLVDRYVAAFRKAGLKLVGIDLEAFALLRALGLDQADESDGERSGLVVVSVGHDRSTFAVSDGRVCEFTRVLDWGGSTLDQSIGEALELPADKAQAVKVQLSLADASVVPTGLTQEQAGAAVDAVKRALEAFARDLVSSLRFYQSQPDSLAIRELVLSGGSAELPGLAAELQRLLDVRVRVGDPLARVKVGRRIKQREHLGSLAAAIGLGIED